MNWSSSPTHKSSMRGRFYLGIVGAGSFYPFELPIPRRNVSICTAGQSSFFWPLILTIANVLGPSSRLPCFRFGRPVNIPVGEVPFDLSGAVQASSVPSLLPRPAPLTPLSRLLPALCIPCQPLERPSFFSRPFLS